MFRMAWSTFGERWQLFAGAILAVSVGVALVQASLLTLIAAVAPTLPSGLSAAEEVALGDRLAGAVTLLGMIVGISVFVAFFVVGSTFSFTVAQRRRDFALIRLVGASRRQVRRLLLGEAVMLGTFGTFAGVVLGTQVVRFEAWMLKRMDFVPTEFTTEWRPWILLVSAATGIGVAAIGSLSSSRRASRVPPLEALRETGRADQVMTMSRWTIGLIALAGATALIVTGPGSGSDPLATSLPGLILAIVALSALAPLMVLLIGRLLGSAARIVLPRSQIRQLVLANVADGVRRTASTAAPVVLLVALVVGVSGATNVVSAGAQTEAAGLLDGDLIVIATEPIGQQLTALEHVRVVSEEVPLRVRVDSVDTPSRFEVNALAVSPASYLQTHRVESAIGDLDRLHGLTVALDQNYASSLAVEVGDAVQLRLDGIDRELHVVATYPYTLSGSPVLLPIELAPTDDQERRYVIQTDEPEAAPGVAGEITATVGSSGSDSPPISVGALDVWIQDNLDNQQRMTQNILLAVLGLVTLYIVIAIANAVVIAGSDRRGEFATAQLTGMTRIQVIQMALWESMVTVFVGVTLGAAAAGATVLSTTIAVSNIVRTQVTAPPWLLSVAVTVGAALLVGLASVLTTVAATRQAPIAIAGARE